MIVQTVEENPILHLYCYIITERSIMRPSAARTSSSPHSNIHPLLIDDSDDENKRLDAELHKDLVNSLRDTVRERLLFPLVLSSDVMSIPSRMCANNASPLCLLSFLLLTDDYHILSQQQQQQQHRECTTLRTNLTSCPGPPLPTTTTKEEEEEDKERIYRLL